MLYTSRYAGPDLTPEEQHVAASLRGYSDDPAAGATAADWVPTWLLLHAYWRWRAKHRWRFDPDAPDRLTLRQFGRAVRRIFPHAQRCRRRYCGRSAWGYAHLSGPDSQQSRRPSLVTHQRF